MKFRDKRKNEVKKAYSIEIRDGKAYITFVENGKEYTYYEDNIDIMQPISTKDNNTPFKVYKLKKRCYRCHKETTIYTYIIFDDGTYENVEYPWDKQRLLKNQNLFAHLQDPSIEYYGLLVIGDDERLDQMLMNQYPDQIKVKYSKTQGRRYPMNLCVHCGAQQGWYFIYHEINEWIKDMKEIPFDEI